MSVEGSTLVWRRIRKFGVLIIVNPCIFSEWITATCFSAAVAFGSVVAIGSRVSKAWTRSAIAAIPCCILSSVVSVDAWDLCNISFMDIVVLLNVSFMDAVNDSIMCIISLNCLPVTKSSSCSSGSCYGGCFLGGMVSGIEKRSSRWLGVSKEEPKVCGITYSLKRLTPLLRVFYLRCRWQPVVMKITRRAWGDCKVNLCCSREGVAWKVKYGG
jgi:hypothetical protein